jgi:hypothetical protein
MATLRGGYKAVALALQEAAEMSASDTQKALSGAIGDQHRDSGTWAYYVDHFGDNANGDVVYSADGDMKQAPYEIGSDGSAKVDFEGAHGVVPRMTYEMEPEEGDHYAAMEESLKAEKLYTELPVYERFISKSERDSAGSGDFAGKGKSFPILKPGDISAAVHSMGRAGSDNSSAATLKSRIIAIAKKKGWTKFLPKAWQSDKTSEAAVSRETGSLKLTESVSFSVDIPLREAFSVGTKIKLIAPGKGSSAWYTEAALKQAATDKIFHAGLPMRIDHPTAAEEAARPEGSVKDWGAVLARDAEWLESYVGKDGKDLGKGLYSEIKPFSDHAQTIQEKGPYAGVSIRANGNAVTEAGRPAMKDGVPLLKEFTSADGADMVTRAGAGGMFLSEAAKPANPNTGGATEMEAAEISKLVEAAVKAALAPVIAQQVPLTERAIRGDAREAATKILKDVTLHEAAKSMVIDTVLQNIPQKDGALDEVKFAEAVNAEVKRLGAVIAASTGSGRVVGMGAAPVEIKPEEAARRAALAKTDEEEAVRIFESLGLPKEAATFAAKGRAA